MTNEWHLGNNIFAYYVNGIVKLKTNDSSGEIEICLTPEMLDRFFAFLVKEQVFYTPDLRWTRR